MESKIKGKDKVKLKEEKEAFSILINNALEDDKYCKPQIPIDPATDAFFEAFDDGIILM
jgi:hypothetical protein